VFVKIKLSQQIEIRLTQYHKNKSDQRRLLALTTKHTHLDSWERLLAESVIKTKPYNIVKTQRRSIASAV